MQLYIGGIREGAQEKEVHEYFSQFGKIDSVKLYRSYGFITADEETGEKILGSTHELNGEKLTVEVAKGKKVERHGSQGRYERGARSPVRRPFRLILEKLPKNAEWAEIRSFVLLCQAFPEYMKILPSGDALLEFSYKQDRDWALKKLNGQTLYGQPVSARLGRKRTDQRQDNNDLRHETGAAEQPMQEVQEKE